MQAPRSRILPPTSFIPFFIYFQYKLNILYDLNMCFVLRSNRMFVSSTQRRSGLLGLSVLMSVFSVPGVSQEIVEVEKKMPGPCD